MHDCKRAAAGIEWRSHLASPMPWGGAASYFGFRLFDSMLALDASQSSDVACDKNAQRRLARIRRAQVSGDDAENGAREAARVGMAALAGLLPADGAVVAGYWPVRGEIDPRPLLRLLYERGCVLGLPAIGDAAGLMEFRRWTPTTRMRAGAFGIPVPPAENGVLEADILLVPLLAFDRRLYRLGYGGGYYDRALMRLRRDRPATRAFGMAFAEQEMERVAREAHDQPLDGVITPAGMVGNGEGCG